MFIAACKTSREAIYGFLASSALKPKGVTASNGSAFMVAPGLLITAAHCVHQHTDVANPVHQRFELIRAPDVGQKMEIATLVAEDVHKDLALLRINNPRSAASLPLIKTPVSAGTPSGSLGFPLAQVVFSPTGIQFSLVERFQGANISTLFHGTDPQGQAISFYETDSLMYGGSSGCPGFLDSGHVFGMHNRSAVDQPKKGGKRKAKNQSTRLAISMWVTSMDIVAFAAANGVAL